MPRIRRHRALALAKRRDRAAPVPHRDAAVGQRQVRRGEARQTRNRALELGGGFTPAPEPDERLAEVVMRLEAVDAAFRQLAEARRAARVVLVAELQQPVMEQGVQHLVLADLVLGIGARRAIGRAPAAHVAERAQFFDEIGRHVGRQRSCASPRGCLRRDAARARRAGRERAQARRRSDCGARRDHSRGRRAPPSGRG